MGDNTLWKFAQVRHAPPPTTTTTPHIHTRITALISGEAWIFPPFAVVLRCPQCEQQSQRPFEQARTGAASSRGKICRIHSMRFARVLSKQAHHATLDSKTARLHRTMRETLLETAQARSKQLRSVESHGTSGR